MNYKKTAKKIWWFIWEDNSMASWLVNIALAFIIIKYIAYPFLGLLLGTPYPIVAVMSSSMEQPEGFETFWTKTCCEDSNCKNTYTQEQLYQTEDITKEQFTTYPFPKGFNKGDIMILYNPTRTKQGDILVFSIPGRSDPIIHRIIHITQNGKKIYKTKGDNNCNSAGFEQHVFPQQALGKAILRIPYLGWLKIIFIQLVT